MHRVEYATRYLVPVVDLRRVSKFGTRFVHTWYRDQDEGHSYNLDVHF
jgi:hypothetical protein